MGGDLNPCPECASGGTILLLDGDFVLIDECPFVYDYSQEDYLMTANAHYQNGHLLYPLNEFPEWIMQGITYLNRIERKRTNDELDEMQRNRK